MVYLHLLHQLRNAGAEDPFSILIKTGRSFHFHGLPPDLWMDVFYHTWPDLQMGKNDAIIRATEEFKRAAGFDRGGKETICC